MPISLVVAVPTAKPVAVAAAALIVWFATYWAWDVAPRGDVPLITYQNLPANSPDDSTAPPTIPSPSLSGVDATGRGGLSATGELPARLQVGNGERDFVGTPSSSPSGVNAPEYFFYTVQRGDVSFDAIARRQLAGGSGSGGVAKLADAIRRANPFVTPNKLIVGRTQLRVPVDPDNVDGRAAAVAGTELTVGGKTYTVLAGDTLSSIASKHLGGSAAWKQLYEANRDILSRPEAIRPGMVLRLP